MIKAKEMAEKAYYDGYLGDGSEPIRKFKGYIFTEEQFNAFYEQFRLEILQKLEEGGWINDRVVYHEFGIHLPVEGGE